LILKKMIKKDKLFLINKESAIYLLEKEIKKRGLLEKFKKKRKYGCLNDNQGLKKCIEY